jgi:hypothetical protein
MQWSAGGGAAGNIGHGAPIAHSPRSLPGEDESVKGLKNLKNLL